MQANEKQIFILSGEIHSGKTEALLQFFSDRKNVFGIYSPDIGGKRFFMNANTKEIFPMEATAGEKNVLSVGKYIFSTAAFDRAISILENALQQNPSWIIIDEIGKLELDKKGFHDIIQKILQHQNQKTKILLVIRDSLLNEALKFFNLENSNIVHVNSIFDIAKLE